MSQLHLLNLCCLWPSNWTSSQGTLFAVLSNKRHMTETSHSIIPLNASQTCKKTKPLDLGRRRREKAEVKPVQTSVHSQCFNNVEC